MDRDRLVELFKNRWPAGQSLASSGHLAHVGLGRGVVDAGLKVGLLMQLRRGVFMPRHEWLALKPWEADKYMLLSHAVLHGQDHVYTHVSAALLHGLAVWGSNRHIHLNVPYQASPSRQAADIHRHVSSLPASAITSVTVAGIGTMRVTTVERTVVDCAMSGDFDRAVVMGDCALASGATLEKMYQVLDTGPGRRGVRRARKVLAALDGRSESAGESRTRLIIAELPLEMPELQITLCVEGREYRPDFAWRDIKLILEFDGNNKYHDYQPTEAALVQERERENALTEAGWRFIRIKWRRLENPDEVKVRIMAAHEAASLQNAA